MSISAALVLFAVCWWMIFFIVLPLRLKTQGEEGDIVPGTPGSAPTNPQIKRKVVITTICAAIVWAVLAGIILSGVITVRDFDVMNRMPPVESDY